MGLFGGLFGGDDTTVKQSSSNKTDVTVKLANQISNTGLKPVLESIREGTEQSRKLFEKFSKSQVVAQITQANAIQDRNDIFRAGFAVILVGGAGFILWRFIT